MKVSVSIPAALLRTADELAQQMGISRSRLFSVAVKRILQDEAITAKINEIYAHESSSLDPVLQSIQFRSIAKNSTKDLWV
jgi:metal-responsive CopG/Arc/MetJ family transcriptional regulator